MRVGRLAVAQRFHARGQGAARLADAYAPRVDAKHDEALRFYGHHGFRAFASASMTLF